MQIFGKYPSGFLWLCHEGEQLGAVAQTYISGKNKRWETTWWGHEKDWWNKKEDDLIKLVRKLETIKDNTNKILSVTSEAKISCWDITHSLLQLFSYLDMDSINEINMCIRFLER